MRGEERGEGRKVRSGKYPYNKLANGKNPNKPTNGFFVYIFHCNVVEIIDQVIND